MLLPIQVDCVSSNIQFNAQLDDNSNANRQKGYTTVVIVFCIDQGNWNLEIFLNWYINLCYSYAIYNFLMICYSLPCILNNLNQ